jgi:23S rRNA (uracil1939-C5)-methyltransferase
VELFQDFDLDLPGLRRVTLRLGDGGALLVALEVEDVEPPALEVDFPVSVALVLPNGTAVNLIGDSYLVQNVAGRDYRVSAGAFFHPSPAASSLAAEAVARLARLRGTESVLELFSGVGTWTAFLASEAAEVVAVEANPDAVNDAAANLDEFDNVSLYEGLAVEILPLLEVSADVIVADPPAAGLEPNVLDEIVRRRPSRFIYISSDVATLARDGRRLVSAGYRPVEIQPIDMFPQTYQIFSVSSWAPA